MFFPVPAPLNYLYSCGGNPLHSYTRNWWFHLLISKTASKIETLPQVRVGKPMPILPPPGQLHTYIYIYTEHKNMTLVPEGFFNPSAGRIRLLHLYLPPAQPHTLHWILHCLPPLKFNMEPENQPVPKEILFGNPSFLGSMLNFRGVSLFWTLNSDLREELQVSGVAC